MCDLADFRTRFPEFDPIDDAIIQMHLEDALCTVSNKCFNDSACHQRIYCMIVFYKTAHELVIAGNQQQGATATTGAVQGITVGETSTQFAVKQSSSEFTDYYRQTTYGAKYLDLIKRYGGSIVTATRSAM